MTSAELKEELRKQVEREAYDKMIKEYLRIKLLVAESGALTHDEVCSITMEVCRMNHVFDQVSPHSW